LRLFWCIQSAFQPVPGCHDFNDIVPTAEASASTGKHNTSNVTVRVGPIEHLSAQTIGLTIQGIVTLRSIQGDGGDMVLFLVENAVAHFLAPVFDLGVMLGEKCQKDRQKAILQWRALKVQA
jgi:hypothetical protein